MTPFGLAFRGMMASSGVAAGAAASYSYALFTWGAGTDGVLGQNDLTARSIPTQVGVQVDWTSINSAYRAIHAIKSNGTLWTWGDGRNGKLGHGDTSDRSVPTQVGNLSNWSLSSGGDHLTHAVKTDGTLWAWGRNLSGALGLGNTTAYSSPVQVGELTTWSTISTSYQRAHAIKTDGKLWSWGKGNTGQLGHGNTTDYSSPVQVGTLTDWSKIASGTLHNLAVKTGGTLWAWGSNSHGRLGDGTTTTRSSPVQIGSLTTWSNVWAGGQGDQSFAIKTDKTMWAWGFNTTGSLGLGDAIHHSSPTQIGSLTDWNTLSSEGNYLGPTGMAVKTDNTLWTWGDASTTGRTAHNNLTDYSSPVQVGGATDWQEVVGTQISSAGIRKINNNAGYALWTWGTGTGGATGHGDTVNTSSPIQVGFLNDWAGGAGSIATGYQNMLAVKVDGTLFAWGNGGQGVSGLGNTTSYSSPMQVGNLSDWSKVGTQNQKSFAIKTDGTLWAWGDNNGGNSGHLGLDNTTDYSSPIQVGELTDWASISIGHDHALAVKTDGTLFAWGDNGVGHLGDGTTTVRSSPVKIGTLTDWSKISCQGATSLAVKTDGTLWSWGEGSKGQLGDNAAVDRSSPVKVGSLTTWAEVLSSSGSTYGTSFAIKTDGTLWAWGDGFAGNHGLGDTVDRSSPVQVGSLTDWATFPNTTGLNNSASAVKTDGTLWVWGDGIGGNLGLRNTTDYSSPVQLGSGAGWNAITLAGSSYQTAALRRPTVADGTTSGYIFASGDNNLSSIPRLGNGNTTDYSTPTQVGTTGSGLKNNWTEVAGYSGGAGVNTAGELWTWGHNSHGQVGDGTTTHRSFPVQVGSLTTWSKVAETGSSFHAIKTDGTLWAWGRNSNGQLGDNTATNRSSPIQVGGLTTWSFINGGAKHFAGIKTDGTLWVNGYGISGELGLGDTAARSSPVQVGSLTDWSKVKMGNGTTAAIKTDGTLWTWGEGGDGQLGDDTTTDRSSPVKVGSLTNWSEIAVCTQSVSAIKTDGTLWTWGNHGSGQLGDGSTAKRSSPAQVGTLTDWSKLNVVHNQSAHAAIKTDGTLWMWGMDNSGSIPNGVVQNESSPVQVEHHTDWLMVSGGQNRMWGIRKAYK